MLQRQILFKQLQEMQHQQQLQESSDARQRNYVNQLSFLSKQNSVGFHPPLINGMPVHDPSQMFMDGNSHLTQHGTSPIIQGVPNGLVFSQTQNQAISSNALLPQQFDASLYGTPIASSRNNINPYPRIQGASYDSANMSNRENNTQLETPVMQPPTVSKSFVNQQDGVSPHKVCTSDGSFIPKNVSKDKNMFGHFLMQASDDGALPTSFQQLHSLERSTIMKQSVTRQEETGWPVLSAGKSSNIRPSQRETSLDPLEERILFNSDDNSWESSIGRQSKGVLGGFASTEKLVDYMGTFSSNLSGSWSALMQSAVAEASRSDTGQQEEWSGLTFQNPEPSADNQHYFGDGKPNSWVDNNLQNISSPTSKSELLFQSSNMNINFSTFQEPQHYMVRQKEGMHSDSSHESFQESPKNASKWFDSNLQQKQAIEGYQLVQTHLPLQNAWHNQRSESSNFGGRQPSIFPYTMSSQSGSSLTGHELKANEWLHENGPQTMVGCSIGPPDQMHSADLQRDSRASEELQPGNNVDSIAPIFDSSADFCGQNMISHKSENMLNLPYKAEKPVDIKNGTHLISGDSTQLSQVPQIENYNLYYNPSASQGSSFRVSPPSQQMPQSYSSLSSSIMGKTSVTNSSGPHYLNNQYQSVTPVANQSPHATLPTIARIFQGQNYLASETLPIAQPSLLSDSTNSNVDAARGSLHELYEQNTFHIGDNSKGNHACSHRTQAYDCKEDQADQMNSSGTSAPFTHNRLVHEHADARNHLSGANPTTSVSMITTKHHLASDGVDHGDDNDPTISGRDLDAFGSSLKPHVPQQSFPLLHQVKLKSGVTNSALGEPNVKSQLNSISSWDNKSVINSTGASGYQLGNHLSKAFTEDIGMSVFGENDTYRHSKEQSQVNVQMSPSWFEHYGNMKNGQMPPMHDSMHRKDAAKQFSDIKLFGTFQGSSSIGQSNSSNASQLSSILPNAATKIVPSQLPSSFLIPLDLSERNLAGLRPKKRKVSAFDLLPWRKEVTHVTQQLQKVSSLAETEWAIASNRLSERVEDEAELMDGVLPISRAKKRLVLTTQLMQQVIRPAPEAILSADVWLNSESMVYFVARLALGDACSMTNSFQKTFLTNDMSSKNLGTSESVGQLDFSKAVGIFMDRAKRLENDLLRLEKAASIVDIKMDSQELERFSFINRLAKFHSRGHLVSVNTSLASGANPAVLKASPQKYVVAHPMPKVVPEGINCMSL